MVGVAKGIGMWRLKKIVMMQTHVCRRAWWYTRPVEEVMRMSRLVDVHIHIYTPFGRGPSPATGYDR